MILHQCTKKLMYVRYTITWCTIEELWFGEDGRKKWHIDVGAPPKNIWIAKRMEI